MQQDLPIKWIIALEVLLVIGLSVAAFCTGDKTLTLLAAAYRWLMWTVLCFVGNVCILFVAAFIVWVTISSIISAIGGSHE